MYCSHCGGQIPADSQFCAKCGTRAGTSGVTNQGTQFGGSSVQSNVPEHKTNIFALLGLIFSLTLGPLLGLIFSLIGLSKAKEMNGEGRGMALAGLWISIVSFALIVIYIIFIISIISNISNWEYITDSYKLLFT